MCRELDQAAGAATQQLQGLLGQFLNKPMCWPCWTQTSKLHLEQEGGKEPEELPAFPSSRSCSVLKVGHAWSRAAMASSYTGLSAKSSNYALPAVFLQRGTRRKYCYFVFALYRQRKVQ